jgi:predicted DNA-binding transcriptional regulator YafY
MSLLAGNMGGMNRSERRSERLRAIADDLRTIAPRGRHSSELAEHYEVSLRTIERDLRVLRASGVPIGRHRRGHQSFAEPILPPIDFTPEEAAAVAIALAHANETPFAQATYGALRKVIVALSVGDLPVTRAFVDGVRIPERAGQNLAVPRALENAIAAHQVLRLSYVDRHDRLSEREIEPVGFAAMTLHWYLVAWCRLRQGPRVFRMDRILAADPTGELAPARRFEETAPPAARRVAA